MPSIRALLDTFGQPPSQICCDWAWQIAAAEPELVGAELGASTDLLAGQDDWTTLDVADDGSLLLAGMSRAMAQRALEDLRSWMPPGESAVHIAAVDRSAVELPLDRPAALTTLVANRIVIDAASTAIDRLEESSAAVPLPVQRMPLSQKPHSRTTHGHTTHRRKTRLWRQSLAISAFTWLANHRLQSSVALAAVCVTGLLLLAWPSSSEPEDASSKNNSVDPIAANAAVSDAANAQNSVDTDFNTHFADTDSVEPEKDRLLAEDAPVAALTTSAELVGFELDGSRKPQGASPPALPLAALEIPGRLLTPKSAAAAAFQPDESAANASTTGAPAASPNESVNPGEPVAAAIQPQSVTASATVEDVMQQVAAVVAEAELHATSSSADDKTGQPASGAQPGTVGDWLRQPPIGLSRERMQHHVELPRGMRERLHDPHWQVLVARTDGFLCEPAGPQLLAPRTSGIFRVYDEEAQSPRACIVFQLVNRGGRDAVLDWQMTGGAEDIAALRLPLSRKWLDPLRGQLRISVAALRALTETPLPSASGELRTLLQNQRRQAGEQLKLGERLLTITAELDRLAALLDGELECHAQLREGPSGRIVLNCGTASTP